MNKSKKNIFSNNPWNDTPYYDPFCEEWTRMGVTDINHKWGIIETNHLKDTFRLTKHECFKWPERI